jgi:hypothetical protein
MAEKRKSITNKTRNPSVTGLKQSKEGEYNPIQLEPGDTVGIENILRKQSSLEQSMQNTKKSREQLLINSH